MSRTLFLLLFFRHWCFFFSFLFRHPCFLFFLFFLIFFLFVRCSKSDFFCLNFVTIFFYISYERISRLGSTPLRPLFFSPSFFFFLVLLRTTLPEHPSPDRPKFRFFFTSPATIFILFLSLSLGVFSWNYGGVFEGWELQLMNFQALSRTSAFASYACVFITSSFRRRCLLLALLFSPAVGPLFWLLVSWIILR